MVHHEFSRQQKVLEFVGGETWDTALWTKDRDDGGNYTCKIRIKVCFKPVHYRTGPGQGYYQEHDNLYGVDAWDRMLWETWKKEYAEVITEYWSGKFWLETPDDYEELNSGRIKPNIRCDLNLEIISTQGGAHYTFAVERIPDYRHNRANAGGHGYTGWLMDVGRGSDPDSDEKIIILDEIAHLFALPHRDRQFSSLNACFRLRTPTMGQGTVLGGGRGTEVDPEYSARIAKFQLWHARPWQIAMQKHTGVVADKWKVSTRQLLPKILPPGKIGKR